MEFNVTSYGSAVAGEDYRPSATSDTGFIPLTTADPGLQVLTVFLIPNNVSISTIVWNDEERKDPPWLWKFKTGISVAKPKKAFILQQVSIKIWVEKGLHYWLSFVWVFTHLFRTSFEACPEFEASVLYTEQYQQIHLPELFLNCSNTNYLSMVNESECWFMV